MKKNSFIFRFITIILSIALMFSNTYPIVFAIDSIDNVIEVGDDEYGNFNDEIGESAEDNDVKEAVGSSGEENTTKEDEPPAETNVDNIPNDDINGTDALAVEVDYDISWYSDDNEVSYTITTAKQLQGLAEITNGTAVVSSGTAITATNFAGKTIKIGENINLENIDWTPIGSETSNCFSGTFDGMNNTISGLSVTGEGDLGLFGNVKDAVIKNLKIEGKVEYTGQGDESSAAGVAANVDGGEFENVKNHVSVTNPTGYAGGIVAYTNKIKMIDCINEGSVSGGTYAGGIGGFFSYAPLVINKCKNKGTVTSLSSAGGILGYYGYTQLSDCINEGSVSGKRYVGGIVGEGGYGVAINRCTNIGAVRADDSSNEVGGILGDSYSAFITNCFVNADITGKGDSYTGGIVGYSGNLGKISNCIYYNTQKSMSVMGKNSSAITEGCYYLSENDIEGYTGFAKPSDSFKYGEITYLLNKGSEKVNWEQGEDYPILAGDSSSRIYCIKIAPFSMNSNIKAKINVPDGVKIFTDKIGGQSIYLNNGIIKFSISNVPEGQTLKIDSTPKNSYTLEDDGTYTIDVTKDLEILYGTEAESESANINWYNPNEGSFKISTMTELLGLEKLVNGETVYGAVDFNGKTIILDDNISLTGLKEPWIPIGTNETPFKGIFDGNSKSVTGLHINNANVEKAYQGFFGYSLGQIKNLTVIGEIVSLGDYVGGIVGYSEGGLTNCKFGNNTETEKSSLKGKSYVGGIAGYCKKQILSSENYGSITGAESNVGGVVGKSTNTVGKSGYGNINYGTITGKDYTGGIAGYVDSSTGYNKNEGIVSGNMYVGGIAGYAYSCDNNTNNTSVKGDSGYVGGIVGLIKDNATNNTNNAFIEGNDDYVGGIAGNAKSKINNNTNKGNINSVKGKYTGGIAGYIEGYYGSISNNNSGNITAYGDYAGGIAGYSKATMSSDTNTGNIISCGNYVGGWVGYSESKCTGKKEEASVNAEIIGSKYVGAVAGNGNIVELVSVDPKTKVYGSDFVGGITGYLSGSNAAINNSYSIATVYVIETAINGVHGGLTGSGKNAKITNSFYYNDGLSKLIGDDKEITIENSYCLSDVVSSITYKNKTSFSNGEVAWLLGGGSDTRNTNWTQGNGEEYPKLGNNSVFRVKLTEEKVVEGNSLIMGDGTYGVAMNAPVTSESAIKSSWAYVRSGEILELTATLTPDRGLLFSTPIKMDKKDNVYSFTVDKNYDCTYNFGLVVAPTYDWYTDPSSITYTLTKESDLIGLSNLVNGLDKEKSRQTEPLKFEGKTILLGEDITILSGNWAPIGTVATPFKGTFDGQCKIITGTAISSTEDNQGLFGYISDAKIMNVTVCGNIYGTGSNVGGIVGTANNSSYFENVQFGSPDDLKSSKVSGNKNTGGIIGRVLLDGTNIENMVIKNCRTFGAVEGISESAGGIVGYTKADGSSSKSSINLENCINNAGITGTNNTGGIIGGADKLYIYIKNCTNNGIIKSTGSYVAGIIGYASGSVDNNRSLIEGCINNGTVTSTNSYTGGVSGYIRQNTHITNCINNGTVTSTNSYTGGLAAYISNNVDIDNCSNTNNIIGKSYTGGIVGYVYSNCSVNNNNNSGYVAGSSNTGGIIGSFSGSDCVYNYNTGSISGESTIGGIVGDFSGSKLSKCYNTGDITASKNIAGGIAGRVSLSTKFMVNVCYNTGSVTGQSIVAGIVAKNGSVSVFGGDDEITTGVSSSYNSGVITSTLGELAGAISAECYDLNTKNVYLEGSVSGEQSDKNKAVSISSEQFSSGQLAYYLDNGDSGDNRSIGWSQDINNGIPIFADNTNLPVYKVTINPTTGGTVNSTALGKDIYAKADFPINLSVKAESGKILQLLTVTNKQTDEVIFSDSNTDSVSFKIPKDVASDVEVNAVFVEAGVQASYTVTYMDNDAIYGVVQTVSNGNKATLPEAPSKSGCIFMGWYTGDNVKWNFNAAITKDIILYAKWKTADSVIITFNANGGKFADNSEVLTVEVKKDNLISLPETPVNGNLEFKGWYTSKTNNIKVTSSTLASEDTTFFAQWLQTGNFYKGSESEPYIIKSVEELESLAEQVNDGDTFKEYYFQLSDNINEWNLTDWKGIGSGSNYFEGNFDGNGVTLNVTGTTGIFGSVRDASLKRFTVNADVVSNSAKTGGVVGYAYAKNKEVLLKDIIVKGNVSGTEQVGGLVGRGYADWGNGRYQHPVYIESCVNEADVSGVSDYVGGIVGFYYSDNHIKNSSNSGNISGEGDATGGIVGYGVYGTFEGCYNTGIVSGMDYVSGLVGSVGTFNGDYTSTFFTDCYNIAEVNGNKFVGGILGGDGVYKYMIGTGKFANFTNCYNTGSIIGTDDYVGGIAGSVNPHESGTSKQVYNTGNVSGNDYVAGLFGERTGKDTAKNCYNIGIITSVGKNMGAIAGNKSGNNLDCYYMAESIANPLDKDYLKSLEEISFTNGEAAYLLDGGSGTRLNYWTQGANHPVKGNPSYYKVELETGLDGGSIDINGTSTVYKGRDENIIINVKVMEPESVTVDGVTKEYKYSLESLKVTQNGETTDIKDKMEFVLLGDSYISAVFMKKEVIKEPEIPEVPEVPEKPEKPVKPEKPDKDNDNATTNDNNAGSGKADGSGTGIGSGNGDGSVNEGTESGNGGKEIVSNSNETVNNNRSSENNSIDDNITQNVNIPTYSASKLVPEEPVAKTDDQKEDNNEDNKEQDTSDDKKDKDEEDEEDEETESTDITTKNSQKNLLTPIFIAIVVGILILVGIYRFIIIKRKH